MVPGPERALGKIPQQPTRGVFTASPSLPQESTRPRLAQEPCPSPSRTKPELAPPGEESGDQLSQLRCHRSRTLGLARSPRGALSASCPGGPRSAQPLCALSRGKSENAEDLAGGAGWWSQERRCFSVQAQTSGWASEPLETRSITTDAPQRPALSSELQFPPSPKACFALTFTPVCPRHWVMQTSFCVLTRAEITLDVSFE